MEQTGIGHLGEEEFAYKGGEHLYKERVDLDLTKKKNQERWVQEGNITENTFSTATEYL